MFTCTTGSIEVDTSSNTNLKVLLLLTWKLAVPLEVLPLAVVVLVLLVIEQVEEQAIICQLGTQDGLHPKPTFSNYWLLLSLQVDPSENVSLVQLTDFLWQASTSCINTRPLPFSLSEPQHELELEVCLNVITHNQLLENPVFWANDVDIQLT